MIFTSNSTTNKSLYSVLSSRRVLDQFDVYAIMKALLTIAITVRKRQIENQAPVKKYFDEE
jgi:hypothetical protein